MADYEVTGATPAQVMKYMQDHGALKHNHKEFYVHAHDWTAPASPVSETAFEPAYRGDEMIGYKE